jgi:Bifunctional DNA primase/polymerase, N-terminal
MNDDGKPSPDAPHLSAEEKHWQNLEHWLRGERDPYPEVEAAPARPVKPIKKPEASQQAFRLDPQPPADSDSKPVPERRDAIGEQAMNPLLAAVLQYAQDGIPVFPCRARDEKLRSGKIRKAKSPHTTNGFKDATTSEMQIREWWTKWPDAMIGAPTGEITGRFVIDSDGVVGEETLARLIAEHGPLPETLEARTGRGNGRHLYFRHPGERIPSRDNALGEKVDTRGDGGYAILPPSRHPSGNTYAWLNDRKPADAPTWLLQLVTKNGTTPKAPAAEPAAEKIPHGQHRERLVELAGKLRATA